MTIEDSRNDDWPVQAQVARLKSLVAKLKLRPQMELDEIREAVSRLDGGERAAGASFKEFSALLEELEDFTVRAIEVTEAAIGTLTPKHPATRVRNAGHDAYFRLRDSCRTFAADSGINCAFYVNADDLQLDSLTAEVIVRCVDELLHAVEMRASASKVEIRSFIDRQGELVLEICDDGIGWAGHSDSIPRDGRFGFELWSIELCLREVGGEIRHYNDHGARARIVLFPQKAASSESADGDSGKLDTTQ
jgi:two-component sensor histidine kinase